MSMKPTARRNAGELHTEGVWMFARPTGVPAAMLQRLLAWFQRIPIDDPVDRRNGVFMQWLLLFEGTRMPLNKLYLLLFNWNYLRDTLYDTARTGPRAAIAIDLVTDVFMALAAWIGIWLIRRGRFRLAVSLYVGVVLGSAALAYGAFGYHENFVDLTLVVVLALSGLMLGRRALWTTYGVLALVFAIGVIPPQIFSDARLWRVALETYIAFPCRALMSYLLIAIVIDRSINALRESLDESNAHRRELKREIAERERTQEQLLHARKMDAVGKLASGIAHDMNNVLGIILGFATERDRLDPDVVPDEDAQAMADALEGVELAARRGAAVCSKLLNFSRHDVTHTETFDAAAALRDIRPLLRQLMPSSVQLSIEMPSRDLPIRFDRSQFELALLNLASNARDAMPDGGQCTITLDAPDTSTVALSIRDSGTGIAQEHVHRIFEPFFTTKPVDRGTGLGLSVVYSLVHRAGGDITVHGTAGGGTTFRIILPMADVTQPSVSNVLPAGRVRVWLIDDDDSLRGVLASALEKGGCDVSEAANGAEAERLVARMDKPPHVLVCDYRMADIDGETLLRRLRGTLHAVPAILISAYLDSDGSSDGPEDLHSERLPKPFSPSVLLARVFAAARREQDEALQLISSR
ncbi:ATP-binding protein [Rhodanobacter sp. L36]|uniref:hybrid sensor histidine kinase/response regulator n=1 Tax=Rhodanobacter sp. L36 TaxID=1747221 RepID=UPI00131E683C|nr:ATP-binding protein [Rhodanobacter sp. L36]